MKYFKENQTMKAVKYALAGGQAVHVFSADSKRYPNAPRCFKKIRLWGHLLDQNMNRLIATGKKLGVRVIRVGHAGRKAQHIDLCGKPLERAIEQSENCPWKT